MFPSRCTFKLILLFVGMAFWGCQKEEIKETVIEGRITEFGSFEPVNVEGLRLALVKKGKLGIFPTEDLKVAEFTTDENGRFYYVAKLDEYHGMYYVELLDRPEGYYALDKIRPLTSSAFNLIQLNLNKEAWLKVVLNNEGGGIYDYFRFSINQSLYSHTGGGSPSVIQRVPSFDTCKIYFSDFRSEPAIKTEYKLTALPNDTLIFEIDLRLQ